MRISVVAESEDEFEEKKYDLVKALIGIPPIMPRKGYHDYQNFLMDYFGGIFDERIKMMKAEISEVIDQHIQNL